MRFAWVLFVVAGSGVGVGWVDHPVAVVAAGAPCNDRQAQEDQQRSRRIAGTACDRTGYCVNLVGP